MYSWSLETTGRDQLHDIRKRGFSWNLFRSHFENNNLQKKLKMLFRSDDFEPTVLISYHGVLWLTNKNFQ